MIYLLFFSTSKIEIVIVLYVVLCYILYSIYFYHILYFFYVLCAHIHLLIIFYNSVYCLLGQVLDCWILIHFNGYCL